jgi:hypothetical protein
MDLATIIVGGVLVVVIMGIAVWIASESGDMR